MLRAALGLLSSAYAANRVGGVVTTISAHVLMAVVALLFFSGATAFLAVAAFWELTESYSPQAAAAIMAAALVAIGGLIVTVLYFKQRSAAANAESPVDALLNKASEFVPDAKAVNRQFSSVTRRYGPVRTILGAAGIGAVLGLVFRRML